MGGIISKKRREAKLNKHLRAYENNPEILQHQALFDQMLLTGPEAVSF
jgi:hypothetical protein